MKKEHDFVTFSVVGEVTTTYKRNSSDHMMDLPHITCATEAVEQFRKVWKPDSMEHHESMYALFVNRANRVLGWGHIGSGGIGGVVCDPKIVFQKALLANASGFFIAHNHPSGKLNPSREDIAITKKLKEAGKAIEIELLDHLILSESSYWSMTNECDI